MMATAMMVVPKPGKTTFSVAVATRSPGACWMASNGSVTRWATVPRTKRPMTMPVPSARDSGMWRRGSLTSPAVNVMLFQASAENSEPVCDTQMDTKRRNGLGARGGGAFGASAGCPQGPEVIGTRRAVPTYQQAGQDQAEERRRLGSREHVLNDPPIVQPPRVGPGQEGDEHDSDELRGRKRQCVTLGQVDWTDQIVVICDPRHQCTEVPGKSDGYSRDRPRLDNEEQRPAV